MEFIHLPSPWPFIPPTLTSLNLRPQPLSLIFSLCLSYQYWCFPRSHVWPFSLSCSDLSPWEIATLEVSILSITNDFWVYSFKPNFIPIASCSYFLLEILQLKWSRTKFFTFCFAPILFLLLGLLLTWLLLHLPKTQTYSQHLILAHVHPFPSNWSSLAVSSVSDSSQLLSCPSYWHH